MAQLLSGKAVAAAINANTQERAAALNAQGCVPTLAILRIGERADDLSYERSAMKRADSLGIAVAQFVLPADADDAAVLAAVQQINDDPTVHGCLMFCPLPKHLNAQAIQDALSPAKDIDGVSSGSLAAVFTDRQGFAPCTAAACVAMLDHYDIDVAGKRVVVIGRSLVIGKPVSMMLLKRNATVTICHSRSKDIDAITRQADVVVCATGRAKAYGAQYFAAGQTILDVGVNFTEDGTMCGDVDFADVVGAADEEGNFPGLEVNITPVPGGVGSVTTALLMQHVVEAAERFAGK